MTPETGEKTAYLICFVVISVAVSGYFVGLQSPMNPANQASRFRGDEDSFDPRILLPHNLKTQPASPSVIPATHYAEIGKRNKSRANDSRTRLSDLKSSYDPFVEFKITPEQKVFALALRSQNRAFNGAPPTVPHPVGEMSTLACAACHTNGAKTESLRIPKMSHQFLANCTQCHVENAPQHMAAARYRENSFVGLPAPEGGPRAFEGAPPQIPHSTWMRVNCLSCHGFAGQQGIRTTHPWRQNCLQCHAPSSVLEQSQIDPQPNYLPSPTIEQ